MSACGLTYEELNAIFRETVQYGNAHFPEHPQYAGLLGYFLLVTPELFEQGMLPFEGMDIKKSGEVLLRTACRKEPSNPLFSMLLAGFSPGSFQSPPKSTQRKAVIEKYLKDDSAVPQYFKHILMGQQH